MSADVVSPALVGIALGAVGVPLFNAVPASWLVDYDEIPDEERSSPVRVAVMPWAPIFVLAMAAVGLCSALSSSSLISSLGVVVAVWILALAAISDAKYTIIPDQAVIALGVLGLVVALARGLWGAGAGIGSELLSSGLGALVGAGSFLLIGLIGSLVTKRDAMGYGDIKLLAAAGMLVAFPGILYVLVLVVLVSGLVFIALILAKRLEMDQVTPLGPYIAFSTALYLLLSSQFHTLFSSYLMFLGR